MGGGPKCSLPAVKTAHLRCGSLVCTLSAFRRSVSVNVKLKKFPVRKCRLNGLCYSSILMELRYNRTSDEVGCSIELVFMDEVQKQIKHRRRMPAGFVSRDQCNPVPQVWFEFLHANETCFDEVDETFSKREDRWWDTDNERYLCHPLTHVNKIGHH